MGARRGGVKVGAVGKWRGESEEDTGQVWGKSEGVRKSEEKWAWAVWRERGG
jgi:hypothetical protein